MTTNNTLLENNLREKNDLGNEIVIEAIHLKKYFPVLKGFVKSLVSGEEEFVHAVDDISLKIFKGETFGLVGESGCGKSTTGFLLLHLIEKTSGQILLKGVDTTLITKREFRNFRRKIVYQYIVGKLTNSFRKSEKKIKVSKLKHVIEQIREYKHRVNNLRKEIQIIFQNPYESLSPRFRTLDIVAEPLRLLKVYRDEKRIEERVIKELEAVGLIPAKDFIERFPHELSGGQRQRVGVARAFALDPEFVVADEPVSMLDVSIRVGVLKIMKKLAKERGTAFLFITHDLALARNMCDRIAVMYLGRIVETGPTEELIRHPLHPYTKALIAGVPKPDPDARRTEELPITGEVPSGIVIPSGCRFHPRCPFVKQQCKEIDPQLEIVGENYEVACIRYKEINNMD
ncbi:MAG: ABC transporter ATP-binding protein [Candidatus Heimdallarchaeaceae archaeon]